MKSVPRCTCLMLCLFLSGGKKRGERKHYCTRESSKALFKLVATINREAASPFINMCYTSSRSQNPFDLTEGPLSASGKQANLNTPIFSGEQRDQYPGENPPEMKKGERKVRIIGRRPTVICELIRINAHGKDAAPSCASLLTVGFANADDGKLPLRDKAIH